MTVWTIVPIIISIAMVLYTYFGLYLKSNDKIADIKEGLTKQIADLKEEVAKEAIKHDTICLEHMRQLALLPEISKRLDMMQAQAAVYYKALDPVLAAAIHSPIHKERDKLVDKLVAGTLTYDETIRLDELLQEFLVEEKDGNRKLMGGLLLGRIRALKISMENSI